MCIHTSHTLVTFNFFLCVFYSKEIDNFDFFLFLNFNILNSYNFVDKIDKYSGKYFFLFLSKS